MRNNILYSNEFMDIVMVNPNYPFLQMKKPGVVIVPYDNEGNVYMIKKSRVNVGTYFELPRGFVERAEDFRIGALRELLEETGLHAGRAVRLGNLQTDTGLMNNHIEVIALGVKKTRNHAHYDKADLDSNYVTRLPINAILSKIVSGEIICSLTLSAIIKYIAFREH